MLISKIKCIHKFLRPVVLITNPIIKFSQVKDRNYLKVVENDSKKTATIIMQKPPVNSFNYEMLVNLTSAVKELEEKNYRGLILASSLPTIFSAGLDIMEMYNTNEEQLRIYWKSVQDAWKTLYATPLITIAAVNGHAPAAGSLFALSCDHVIMVNSKAKIGLNESLLGLIVRKWFRNLFVNVVGFRQAEHSIKLGTLFTAEQAYKLNIVNDLVDSPAELMQKAESEMDNWLKIPQTAMQMTKISMRKPHVDELESYAKQDVDDIVNFTLQQSTQEVLAKYLENLKKK